jgi:hypothetical protein
MGAPSIWSGQDSDYIRGLIGHGGAHFTKVVALVYLARTKRPIGRFGFLRVGMYIDAQKREELVFCQEPALTAISDINATVAFIHSLCVIPLEKYLQMKQKHFVRIAKIKC